MNQLMIVSKCSLIYRIFPQGVIRELRFQYDMLEFLFDNQVYERRRNRRFCDFVNAANYIKSSGAIVEKEIYEYSN